VLVDVIRDRDPVGPVRTDVGDLKKVYRKDGMELVEETGAELLQTAGVADTLWS
jgi:hypothetical protein